MEKPYHPPSSSDEINLLPILRYIKRKIDGFFRFVVYLFELLARQYQYVGRFLVVGLVVGLLYYSFKPPVYKSTAIYTSNLMNNQFNESFINEIRWLTREDNYEELSKLLAISYDDAKNIKKIEFEAFLVPASDTTMAASFKVHAYVKDVRLFDSLQYRILDYMESNIYGHKRKSVKVETLSLFSDKMHEEMIELDSIKKVISLQAGQLTDLVETYRQVIDLYMERYKLMERIALANNYELVQQFSSYRKPYSPRVRHIVFSICIFGIVGMFFAHRKDKDQKKVASLSEEEGQINKEKSAFSERVSSL